MPPKKNLIRYYGTLAPKSPLCPVVVTKVEKEAALRARRGKVSKPPGRRRVISSPADGNYSLYEDYPTRTGILPVSHALHRPS